MNCCNPMTGQCDQGPGCAAYMNAAKGANELPVVMFDPPEQPVPSANLAARTNDYIRRLEAGRAHLLTLSDTPGNWWDKLPWYGRLGTVCGVVLAVGLLVVLP